MRSYSIIFNLKFGAYNCHQFIDHNNCKVMTNFVTLSILFWHQNLFHFKINFSNHNNVEFITLSLWVTFRIKNQFVIKINIVIVKSSRLSSINLL